MPICRTNFDGSTKDLKNIKNDTFNDNDEVFFCEVTKEIFRDYEDYFRHVMVINSTVWQCEATGRENLTYAEALKSEKRARKKMEQFKESLRAPVMLVIESAKQSSMNLLCTITTKFLRKRYFLNEIVTVIKSPNYEYKVLEIQLPDGSTPINNNIVYEETENLNYKVQRLNGNGKEMVIPFGGIRRQRMEFTIESLQMFIKHNVTRVDGILRPKPESYKKYVADHNIFFNSLFIGRMPHFTPAKIRRPQLDGGVKKQSTMNKYLVKNNDDETNSKSKVSAEEKEKEKEKEKAQRAERAEQKAKSLKEQMERLRMEKLLKIEKMEREKLEKRARFKEKITAECDALLNKTDDLERTDQRLLPVYRPVKTYIDSGIVGDAFMIREFMHSFCGILSGIEVFRNKLNFFEMSRAFSINEVGGPLSDILLILLGTIFDLQKEEDRECSIKYTMPPNHLQKHELFSNMQLAALTHFQTKRSFSFNINELPIDALTISEVLRLHLLSSGAAVNDRTEKWRIMYRNGYNSTEDPGFDFIKNHSRILRALAAYPIYQLEFPDIINLIQCLIAQILTYSSPINLIEERLEQQAVARNELKNSTFLENRRLTNVQNQRRLLTTDHNQKCLDLKENIDEQKRILEEKLNRKVADLLVQSDREHRKYEEQAEKLNTKLFDFLVFLGLDRAYRKYYVFESLPGIFIETNNDFMDTCFSEPPINTLPGLVKFDAANLPRNRKDLRSFLEKFYRDEEKASEQAIRKSDNKTSSIDDKENQENRLTNGMETLPNGHISNQATNNDTNANDNENENENAESKTLKEDIKTNKPPTQNELFMCSGDPNNCIVHSERHSGRQQWSYIYQQEEINALIDSLNPLGERESHLREQLIALRTLILEHAKKCPYNLLTITDSNKFKTNMLTETCRKYSRANYGLNEVKDMGLVMHFALVERILQFENDIYSGDLGHLKVKDMERWRDGVLNNKYDSQATLHWGFAIQNNGVEESEIFETNNEFTHILYKGHRFIPGENLSAERHDDENGNDFSLDLKKETLDTMQKTVRDLASALLQVEQAIERRFFKYPYGTAEIKAKEVKDKELMERKQKEAAYRIKNWEISLMESTSFSQVFLHLHVLHDCINWSRSTNKSLCQICRRGSDPEKMLLCDECNGGTHMFCMKPKMKKVPEGNWYCQRCVNRLGLVNEIQQEKKPRQPKRKFIMDDADNSSETSSLSERKRSKEERSSNQRSRKHLPDTEIEDVLAENSSDEDDDDDEEEEEEEEAQEAEDNENSDNDDSAVEDESVTEGGNVSDNEDAEETIDNQSTNTNNDEEEEDEAICHICSYDGSDLFCSKCKDAFHLECVNLRRPPRYIFVCQKCRTREQSKRKHQNEGESTEDDDEDDNSETPQPSAAKRARPTRSSLRGSLQHNGNDNIEHNNARVEPPPAARTSGRRSLRRTGDDLPLNSAALYKLLEDVMKSEEAWPFLRPVTQSEVPDYHKIIKNPMDLAKVKSKLNMGEYHLNEEVMNDIQLVFKNCQKYNEKDNEVYQAGRILEKSVIELCKDLQLPYIPSSINK